MTDVEATPHLAGERIELRWALPPASDFAGGAPLSAIRVLRRERTFPEDDADGTRVYDGPVVTTLTDVVPQPGRTYYYTVFAVAGPDAFSGAGSRAAATATRRYGHARDLYDMLPAIHQRLDAPLGPAELAALDATNPAAVAALGALPPDLRDTGQLRRFLDVAAAPLDVMRGLAEALPEVHDVDFARPEFMPMLASLVGWQLDRTLPVYGQRNEVKAAPRLHRRVGTIPSLRELVTRYTKWHAQVAEYGDYLFRANQPPQLNVFALAEGSDGAFRGVDDAAPVLGLPAGAEVHGTGSSPATIVGAATGPFALRSGMEVALTVDDRLPTVTRFGPGDFAEIGAATPTEVAAAIERTQSELSARATAGALDLRSHSIGVDSTLKIERYATTLVSLEAAPRGRPAVLRDSTGRLRVFYEVADALGPAKRFSSGESFADRGDAHVVVPGRPAPPSVPSAPQLVAQESQGRVRYKTFQNGEWSPSRPVTAQALAPEGDPVVLEPAPGQLFVAWVENPGTAGSRIRFTTGATTAPRGAAVRGTRTGPFSIRPGTTIVVRGNWSGDEGISFSAGDFADPRQATTAEVVAALNAGLARVDAFDVGGAVELRTTGTGGREQLELVVERSSAAAALGFGADGASATGSWGDEVAWNAARDVAPAVSGRHADLTGVVDPGTGVVWLFWSRHNGSTWELVAASWDGAAWSSISVLAAGGAAQREPCALLDDSTPWLIWSRCPPGTPEVWTLRIRRFDFATATWAAAERAVTAPPASGGRQDRQPGAVRRAAGSLDVFFRSDRGGGTSLWRVNVTAAAPPAAGAPVQVTSGPFADGWPAPVSGAPDGRLWLLYRSDRSVPLSRIATRELPTPDNRVTSARARPRMPVGPALSVRAADAGTVRRFVGSTAVPLEDLSRILRRRRFDDPLAYTPMGVEGRGVLGDDDLYTRGTVGLFLSRSVPRTALSEQQVRRLKAVLHALLPINVRPVVVLAPRVDVEFVYGAEIGVDIGESYADSHPDIEYYTGLAADERPIVLPDWALFHAVDLSVTPTPVPSPHRSGNPADRNTLRSRTHQDSSD